MQSVSKRTLQWYSKCCYVASVTETLKAYKLSIVQSVEHLQYRCKVLFKTLCTILHIYIYIYIYTHEYTCIYIYTHTNIYT
jgi:hypothetical protein